MPSLRLVVGLALISQLATQTAGQYFFIPDATLNDFNSSPYYCTGLISSQSVKTCPATLCYLKVAKGLCCMGAYQTNLGSVYQQCICRNDIACSYTASPTTATTVATGR
ncbi:unnamed protein product [Lymnaea stagnalis]|uniref:Uncharacterized protein n=1 Tax=Lymnaea stagnalis TaxID=6523 RepID=A0AAV2HLF5_LYMST